MSAYDVIDREDETALAHRATAMVEVANTRAAQEVQAAMVIAKKFPRDQDRAIQNILQSCKRRGLAESALYTYPKGGKTVEGPSIRLAEVLAQAWGNVDFGIVELEQRNGESTMMSYAWDLETNTRQTKIFTVRHQRHTRNGASNLNDPRDIYELTANQGARRLRACILGVIPGDIVDSAVDECNKTMKGNNKEPLIDRIRQMTSAFSDLGVTIDMIEKRLGHRLDVTSETELVVLRKIFRSLKDNMAAREDFFPVETKMDALNNAFKPSPHPTDEKQTIDRADASEGVERQADPEPPGEVIPPQKNLTRWPNFEMAMQSAAQTHNIPPSLYSSTMEMLRTKRASDYPEIAAKAAAGTLDWQLIATGGEKSGAQNGQ